MLYKLLAATALYNSPYRYFSKCKAQWKPGSRVTDRLTDLPRPVHSLHLCLLSNRFWSNTLWEGQKMCTILSAAADQFSRGTGGRHRQWRCRVRRFHISRTMRTMSQNSRTCCGNNSQGIRAMICDLKMFMSRSNYELHKARGSNIFVCHSGVLKNTV